MEHTTDNNQNQQKTDNQQEKTATGKKPVLKIDPKKTIPYIQEGAKPKNR
ncbi:MULTISPECIES: hypothetical protein [Microcystis]|uniref:Uncharacterized protein n=2 Tax=Microcystis TaxID=1125 RepID=A0A841UM22_MICAE|nr:MULTISPECIES: hypothetical protein [Microcystis]AKV70437.1 hypothetical protein VL20_5616 [Microcystis panniformis FACHB-1757]MBC1190114.1 hypothetical protein [Microcystis aeruginosa BLCC-F108]MCA2592795.1 hypothetical protein [Microcystis sp. M31BS1]MDB9410563.1 hypothetical protein [Microcystis aeruginosa CS-558/01A06]